MAAQSRDDELASLIRNPRHRMLTKRSMYLHINHPPQEHSYYPYKCGITELIFPPQKGFMIKPQCRIGNFAHPRAGPGRWRSDSMESKTVGKARFPDDVVVWLPYNPQASVNQVLPHIPVLVEEVKPVMALDGDDFEAAEKQLIDYVRYLNDPRLARNAASPQQARRRVPGLLVIGTRCIRYEAIGPDDGIHVVALEDDKNPDKPGLRYDITVLKPTDKVLLNWLFDLRDHYVAFNAPGKLFPGWLDVEIAKYERQDPAYEASLHGILYALLNAVARSLTKPGESDDWFLVKPQAPLRRFEKDNNTTHHRNTSYGIFTPGNSLGLIDFVLAWLKPPLTHVEMIRDTPALVVELKRANTDATQKEVFAQIKDRMEVFRGYRFLVDGLAVLGARWWLVKQENGVPVCPNWANANLLSGWRTIANVCKLSRPHWTRRN